MATEGLGGRQAMSLPRCLGCLLGRWRHASSRRSPFKARIDAWAPSASSPSESDERERPMEIVSLHCSLQRNWPLRKCATRRRRDRETERDSTQQLSHKWLAVFVLLAAPGGESSSTNISGDRARLGQALAMKKQACAFARPIRLRSDERKHTKLDFFLSLSIAFARS